MGHHAHDVALLVEDAGYIAQRAVGVGLLGDVSILRTVAEGDSPLRLQPLHSVGVGEVVSLAVRDGHTQNLRLRCGVRESRRGVLNPQVDPLAAELQMRVPGQHSWQQPGLAQYLEAVADSDHQTAARRELLDRFHHRREPRNRPRAQIVAVREPSRQDDAVVGREIGILVPYIVDGLAEDLVDDVVAVGVAPRSREDDHAESHRHRIRITGLPPFSPSRRAAAGRLWRSPVRPGPCP